MSCIGPSNSSHRSLMEKSQVVQAFAKKTFMYICSAIYIINAMLTITAVVKRKSGRKCILNEKLEIMLVCASKG